MSPRYALLIGINEYDDKRFIKLGAPEREAKEFGDLLEKYGDFEVELAKHKGFVELRTEIDNFCSSRNQEDILLFYFNGHGKRVGKGKKFYFVTKETDYLKPSVKGISAEFVKDALEDSKTKAQVVILDCCHSEAYISKGDPVASQISSELMGSKGLFILVSSLAWQKSYEDPVKPLEERTSFFTDVLIEGIITGKADISTSGKITFGMLCDYVHDNIKTDVQNPVDYTKSRGYIDLTRNPKGRKSQELNCWVDEDFREKRRCEFLIKYAKDLFEKEKYSKTIIELTEARNICKNTVHDVNLITEIDDILDKAKENMQNKQDLDLKRGLQNYDIKNYRGELQMEYENVLVPDILEPFEDVVKIYDKSLEIGQEDTLMWINKGNSLLEIGEYEEALECYNKALEINPEHAGTWANKGISLQYLRRYGEALESYDKALEINPEDKVAWANKGESLQYLGRYEEAVECYDKALEIDLNYKYAWVNKGVTLSDLKRYKEALECYEKALAIDQNYKYAWYSKGITLRDLKRYQEALESYEKALALDHNYKEAWVNKGVTLSDLKRYKEALECYEKALAIDQNYKYAWYNKACLESLQNNKDKTIEHLKKAINLDDKYKEKAKKDSDFNNIRDSQEFKELIEG